MFHDTYVCFRGLSIVAHIHSVLNAFLNGLRYEEIKSLILLRLRIHALSANKDFPLSPNNGKV